MKQSEIFKYSSKSVNHEIVTKELILWKGQEGGVNHLILFIDSIISFQI